MKTLKELLRNTPVTALTWRRLGRRRRVGLRLAGRRAGRLLLRRARHAERRARLHLAAVAKGAAAVVCECLPEQTAADVAYIVVPDAAGALADMAAAFYDHPSRALKLVGITGTNGKTRP